MREWADVAVLLKTKNLKGGLVVQGTAGLPFLLQVGDEVAFVPPQTDLPRRARVASVLEGDGYTAQVLFEGVGEDEARGLVGCHCLVRRSMLADELYAEEPALWEGWRVVDESAGEVGEVAGFAENPGQSHLLVRRADGRGELLVPVVDDIVLHVDAGERLVRVALPNGLLEL